MRHSDAVAAVAILCGTLLGADLFKHLNSPRATHSIPHVRVVEIPVEAPVVRHVPLQERTDGRVELRVTSLDPTREASLAIEMNGHPIGARTDVVTPFTLISTRKAIEGHLTTAAGDPEVRVELSERSAGPSTTARAWGSDFLFDSHDGPNVQRHDGHR